jgi:acid stress-induced BolA-like protein IbaG/YrbA
MISAEELKTYIQNGINCEWAKTAGKDGRHYRAIVVSAEFRGLNMVKQHQMVYKALGNLMDGDIHALALRTFTPEDWATLNDVTKSEISAEDED